MRDSNKISNITNIFQARNCKIKLDKKIEDKDISEIYQTILLLRNIKEIDRYNPREIYILQSINKRYDKIPYGPKKKVYVSVEEAKEILNYIDTENSSGFSHILLAEILYKFVVNMVYHWQKILCGKDKKGKKIPCRSGEIISKKLYNLVKNYPELYSSLILYLHGKIGITQERLENLLQHIDNLLNYAILNPKDIIRNKESFYKKIQEYEILYRKNINEYLLLYSTLKGLYELTNRPYNFTIFRIIKKKLYDKTREVNEKFYTIDQVILSYSDF